jgi:hypothetical protein
MRRRRRRRRVRKEVHCMRSRSISRLIRKRGVRSLEKDEGGGKVEGEEIGETRTISADS